MSPPAGLGAGDGHSGVGGFRPGQRCGNKSPGITVVGVGLTCVLCFSAHLKNEAEGLAAAIVCWKRVRNCSLLCLPRCENRLVEMCLQLQSVLPTSLRQSSGGNVSIIAVCSAYLAATMSQCMGRLAPKSAFSSNPGPTASTHQ